MTTYSPESQMNFSIQWFKSWSEIQKDDFVIVLAQKLKEISDDKGDPTDAATISNLANGIKGIDTNGRPPSLFLCQIKLFNEWWTSWSSSDRDKMIALLKEADPSFYTIVESEMEGSRKVLNEDFMINDEKCEESTTTNGNVESVPPVFNVTKVIINNNPSPMSSIDLDNIQQEDVTVSSGNGTEGVITVSVNGETSPTEPVATEI